LKIKPTANKVYHPVTRSLSTTTNLQSKFEDGFAETAGRITAWAILTGGVSGRVWYGCKRSRSFVLRRSTRAWKSAGQGISGRISKEKERAQSWTRSGKARFDETVGKSCREGTRVVTKLCEATGEGRKKAAEAFGIAKEKLGDLGTEEGAKIEELKPKTGESVRNVRKSVGDAARDIKKRLWK